MQQSVQLKWTECFYCSSNEINLDAIQISRILFTSKKRKSTTGFSPGNRPDFSVMKTKIMKWTDLCYLPPPLKFIVTCWIEFECFCKCAFFFSVSNAKPFMFTVTVFAVYPFTDTHYHWVKVCAASTLYAHSCQQIVLCQK